jgi:hypothetical protein
VVVELVVEEMVVVRRVELELLMVCGLTREMIAMV